MMPVLRRGALQPQGVKRFRCSGSQDHWLRGFRQRTVSNAGFTLVEVVVSSSILAFALAGSFRGWSQGQALVQQANQRQALLDAIEQDLQRQQGGVIRNLNQPPWACDLSLADLQKKLEALLPHNLPDTVTRRWFTEGQPPALAIHYTTPNLRVPRKRLLALSRGAACDQS